MNSLIELNLLDDQRLLDLYANMVRTNHYDPHETPKFAKDLYEAGISEDDIRQIVISRMSNG